MNANMFKPKEPFNSTVGTSFNIGWDLIGFMFGNLLLVALIQVVTAIIQHYLINGHDYMFVANSFSNDIYGALFVILITIPVSFGAKYLNLQVVRGGSFNLMDIFSGFSNNYLNVVLSGILLGLIILVGLVLLIVPGIIFACKLSFVPYLVIDKQLTAIDAIKTSWEMTNGHAITIFIMFLLSIPIVILGLLALIVGIIPASMWIDAAFASFYHSVDMEYNKEIISEDA